MHKIFKEGGLRAAHWGTHYQTFLGIAQGKTQWWDSQLFKWREAFSDLPVIHFWEELLEKFPDAKFVHSERDEEAWIKSVRQHQSNLTHNFTRDLWDTEKLVYGIKRYDEEIFREVYRQRNREIKENIPLGQLLVCDITTGGDELRAEIEEFVGITQTGLPMPHTHKTKKKPK